MGKAVTAISNTDSLLCSKNESDAGFGFLSNLMSGASADVGHIPDLARQLDSGDCPIEYKNMGNIILAEAARRFEDLELASDRLSRVTNRCLQQLTNSYFDRFSANNELREGLPHTVKSRSTMLTNSCGRQLVKSKMPIRIQVGDHSD